MKESVKLLHYVDPGHSWLRVPLKMLKKLGIDDQISSFSYQRTDYAYLEEDCDMTVFLKAMEAKGKSVVYVTRQTDRQSRIRNYSHYQSGQNPNVLVVSSNDVTESSDELVSE